MRIVDPVLTFCRGDQMHFYQLHTSDGRKFRAFCLQRVDLSFVPINFHWLNARCLILLDQREEVHLYEAGVGDGAIETVSASDVHLVYASSDFKGLATGGNVSPALACLADKACYQSMISDGAGRVYLLGIILKLPDTFSQRIVPICVDACATIGRHDLLYGEIYERFSRDGLAKGFFLECLEEFLLDGSLPNVPPALVQDYLTHLEEEGLLGTIETSVVRLPIESIDLHQVMTLCRAHKLYDGIIYVHNQALKDYITPLKEMLVCLESVIKSNELLRDEDIQLGNKVLLYLSCCLCGRAYPVGVLLPAEAKSVSKEVFSFLITGSTDNSNSQKFENYPYLRVLMRFDTREFLNVLSMTFDSEYFLRDARSSECQEIIDILLQIVLNDRDFNAVQMGAFFTFIARIAVLQNGRLAVSKKKFHQLLEAVLCAGEETVGTSSFEERQQAVLDLLQAPVGQKVLDTNVILSWAEQGKYLHVCEFIYWQQRDFDKVLQCYLDDPFRNNQVFRLMRQFLGGSELLNSEKIALRRKIHDCVLKIAMVDVRQCAEFILDFLDGLLGNLTLKMNCDENCFRELLKEMFAYRQSSGQSVLCSDETVARNLVQHYLCLLCTGRDGDGSEILKFIRDWEIYTEGDEAVLKICRQRRMIRAVVYLLEQRGALDEAFEVLNEALNEVLKKSSSHDGETTANLCDTAREFVCFCRRCSGSVGAKERCRRYWFQFMDTMLNIHSEILNSAPEVKGLLSDAVHAMISYVEPGEVLEKLYSHPAFRGGLYSEYEDLISTILKGYDYEEVLLEKLIGAIHGDVHEHMKKRLSLTTIATATAKSQCLFLCAICNEKLDRFSGSRRIVLFKCQHVYHVSCIEITVNAEKEQSNCLLCPICNKLKVDDARLLQNSSETNVSPSASKKVERKHPKSGKLRMLEEANNPFTSGSAGLFGVAKFPLRLAPPRRKL